MYMRVCYVFLRVHASVCVCAFVRAHVYVCDSVCIFLLRFCACTHLCVCFCQSVGVVFVFTSFV